MSLTTLYTVGHGSRTIEELLDLLDETGISVVVDIRAHPHSKRYPNFSEESFRLAIEQAGKTYHWAGRQLGGYRQPTMESQHIALQDEALRGFADYMSTDAFQVAATQLINMADQERTVILCAEILPTHCHRSLIADYLTLKGVNIIHLISDVEIKEHYLSEFVRRESYELIYDRNAAPKSAL
ncbi:MAG: DUF488 domain-containing protein [Gammaproteobacteria bacterium]|nr:DUF488 domain-containing protein [Gammaproteobacteria bacterium]